MQTPIPTTLMPLTRAAVPNLRLRQKPRQDVAIAALPQSIHNLPMPVALSKPRLVLPSRQPRVAVAVTTMAAQGSLTCGKS
jgi:hypothetical protein